MLGCLAFAPHEARMCYIVALITCFTLLSIISLFLCVLLSLLQVFLFSSHEGTLQALFALKIIVDKGPGGMANK